MDGNLIIRPHVLSDREELRSTFDEGVSIQDIVNSVWPAELHDNVVMAINGNIVPQAYWAKVYPKQHAFVRGVLVLRGGGKKNILGIVASIAVAIAAPYLGAGLAGAMGVTSAVGIAGITAGVAIVGNMLVGALFKPPSMDVGGPSTDPKDSPVYSISGQANQATPYSPIPRVYGRHKMFPRLAATPFVDNQASNQLLYMLLDFGYGPLQVEDILIGETPISSYKNVDYRIHAYYNAGDPLELYPADVAVEALTLDLQPSEPIVRSTELQTTRIALDFVFPRGMFKIGDHAGVQSAVDCPLTIHVAPPGTDMWSSEWVGFNAFPARISNSASRAALLSTTAIQNGDVEFYASYYLRARGRESKIYGLPAGATELTYTGGVMPVGGSILLMPDGVRVGISSVVGNTVYLATGLPHDYEVGSTFTSNATWFRIVLRLVPGNVSDADGVVTTTANTNSPLFLTVEFDVPTGDYDVRVIRYWPAEMYRHIVYWDCSWVGLRSFANRPPIAPAHMHTIMELKIQASDQLSGSIQNLSAVCTAILDGYTSGTTPGTSYTPITTRNPAWAFLDVLRGTANPRPLSNDRIDHDSIRAWAEYCDSLVAVEGAEDEPRQLFDHVVDYRTTIYKLLDSIAGVGRATVSWRDGKIGVIMDKDQTVPVQMFTPRNSWGFEASRKYLEEPHAFRCKFIDPVLGYQEGIVTVYADNYDETNATKFEDLQLFGITRATQAWRDGRYTMAQGLLRREEFVIQADLENLACLRGDLVWVQHDVLKVGGDSSRVSSIVSDTVITQYDALPSLPAGSYGVRIRRDDGTFIGPVAATPTPPYTWTLSAPVDGVNQFDLIVWGEFGIETGEYLVKRISPGNDFTASVELVEIARAVYDADTGEIPPYVPPANGRPDTVDPRPVTGLKIIQVDKTVNRRPAADIILQWNVPRYGNYPVCRVYEVGKLATLIPVADTTTNAATIATDVDLITSRYLTETVRFGVQAIDWTGARSELAYVAESIVQPKWVPDKLPFLSSNVAGLRTTLTWRDPYNQGNMGNQQIIGYEIRWSANVNATFSQASRVTERITWGTYSVTIPTRNGVYLIKPVTSSGVYSVEAAKTVTHVQDLVRRDWYSRPRFNPLWAGQFIDCEMVGNELRLSINPETGDYYGVGYWVAQYKEVFNQTLVCRIDSFMEVYGFRDDEVLNGPRWTPIDNATPITDASADDYDARLWVAGGNVLDEVMADWTPLADAVPLAGSTVDLTEAAWPIISGEVEARQISFVIELRSMSPGCTPSVTAAGADIDFPERLETHNDVAVPVGGYRVTFDYPFVFTPNIAVTLQNAQPGQYVERYAADQYGVSLFVKNSSGAAVTGSVDLQVWGVGRVTV